MVRLLNEELNQDNVYVALVHKLVHNQRNRALVTKKYTYNSMM
jgi:hypothetical protein